MPEKVLVIAPHPDDEAIGCGGMICLHRGRGDPVRVAFLTSGERGLPGLPEEAVRSLREAEAEAAGAVLGVERIDFLRLPDMGLDENVGVAAERLRRVLEMGPPDLIYLPHPEESHPDHAAALPITRAAVVGLAAPPELRAYEVWNPMTRHGWVEDVSAVMARKLRAIRCYRSQLDQMRYDRAARGLALYRGAMAAGSRYAEAFAYVAPGPSQLGLTASDAERGR
jgi:LmbE family N-acetylglucosaminyl deacetylase